MIHLVSVEGRARSHVRQRKNRNSRWAHAIKAVGDMFAFGQIMDALSGIGSGVGVSSSETDAIATSEMRGAVIDAALAEGRPGFQLTEGPVTGEEFWSMASRFLGSGAKAFKEWRSPCRG